MEYSILIHKAEEGGFWSEVPALPGCVSQGETIEGRSRIRRKQPGPSFQFSRKRTGRSRLKMNSRSTGFVSITFRDRQRALFFVGRVRGGAGLVVSERTRGPEGEGTKPVFKVLERNGATVEPELKDFSAVAKIFRILKGCNPARQIFEKKSTESCPGS